MFCLLVVHVWVVRTSTIIYLSHSLTYSYSKIVWNGRIYAFYSLSCHDNLWQRVRFIWIDLILILRQISWRGLLWFCHHCFMPSCIAHFQYNYLHWFDFAWFMTVKYALSALTLLVGQKVGIWFVKKTKCRYVVMVVWLKRGGNDLHMFQSSVVAIAISIVSCSRKIQNGWTLNYQLRVLAAVAIFS